MGRVDRVSTSPNEMGDGKKETETRMGEKRDKDEKGRGVSRDNGCSHTLP